MGGNSYANYQRSHRTKWDDQTLWSLSTSGPNAFLFSSRSVMLESSLKSYLRCLKATDVISSPPSSSATSWYWRLCLYTVVLSVVLILFYTSFNFSFNSLVDERY